MSLDAVDHGPQSARAHRLLGLRTMLWLSLCILEAVAVSWAFELPYWFSTWGNPFTYLRQAAVWGLISVAAFGVLAWPRREALSRHWAEEQMAHAWRPALLLNLALFAVLLPATHALTRYSAGLSEPPVGVLCAFGLLLGATAISLLRIDVSLRSAWRVATLFGTEALIAAGAGLTVLLMSLVSLHGWEPMAAATLTVAKAMLDLFEADVAIDPAARMLRIGDFAVIVTRNCSGYEGIALVVAFLSIYLWVFRERMRFPRAFLLYPIGIVAIWLLNSARIALLASLGAHVSPAIAVQGFHSQAGWIAFIAATIGIMVLAQRSAFCLREPGRVAVAPVQTAERTLLAFVVPFMALMAASIAMAAVAPYDRPLYVLKVIAVGVALWFYRDVYRGLTWRAPLEAYAAGLVVGAVWIATDVDPVASELGEWLARHGSAAAGLWLLVRIIGAVVTVPIAEELAFRGLLHRWLIARDFHTVPFERFTPLALVASSLLFGLMHERWIAGALSGAVFALVMYRTRSLAGPIAAHVTANAVICLWAIAFRQWSLL